MQELLRQGGRAVCFAALWIALSSGCSASRAARAARTSSVEIAQDESAPSAQNAGAKRPSSEEQMVGDSDDDARILPVVAEAEAANTDQAAAADAPPEQTPVTKGASSYPLDLGGALGLADGQSPQVMVARERINEAYAQVDRADVLWLPSLRAGLNYNKHEGAIQDVAGTVFNTSRGSLYGGLGAGAVGAGSPAVPGLAANFHLTDALFQPKITRYQASSRQYAATTVRNDVLCETAVAYLELLRAEQRLAIAREVREKTLRLADLTGSFARVGQGAAADHDRMLAELAARDGDIPQAEEAVATASTRLAFLIHADPAVPIITREPFVAPLNFTAPESTAHELVAQGLSRRPELAEHRQLVGEACERLRREQYAPLIPSVLLGVSYGGLGGGLGSSITNTDDRFDGDVMAYWELRNLGFGEQAIRCESASRLKQAQWRQIVVMDRIAQEVVEAHAQVEARRRRIDAAKSGITSAERSYDLNLQRIENARGLPIEALQSVQALAQARRDYLNAVIDHNIAQMKLCRATGWFEEPTAAVHDRLPD